MVMLNTLEILGEPPVGTLKEGQARIVELVESGKILKDQLEDIVDYAIDSVKRQGRYRVI